MRVDAERNRARILDTAIEELCQDPDASMIQIARAAGVGRMTLYGHFPTRETLVEAAFTKAMDDGNRLLAGLDLTGDARTALQLLIKTSWQLVDRNRALLLAAQSVLPPGGIRAEHHAPRERVVDLIRRGQREGVFRTDLSDSWLAGVLHSVIHGATEEIAAGRLQPSQAAEAIDATILPAFVGLPGKKGSTRATNRTRAGR